MATKPDPKHMETLWENLGEVSRLYEIHTQISGHGPGYKHDVQVLNKSAVVLLVACWEAFIEDLALSAFDEMLEKAVEPDIFPPKY